MQRHLGAGGQVLLYLNRRGYAPTLFCPACGWCARVRTLRCAVDRAPARALAALPPLRLRAGHPGGVRRVRSTRESSGPGHRAHRGDAAHAAAGRAARAHRSRRHTPQGHARGRAGQRARRHGARARRHADAHQGSRLSGREPGRRPQCRPGPFRHRFSRERAAGADDRAGRRTRGTRRATRARC